MKLFSRHYGEGPPVIILHGIFGFSDNWVTLGRKLAERYSVFLVDLRNHGLSPHSDVFDFPSMTEDIREFIEDHELGAPALIGHSLGGKVAMSVALYYPARLSRLVVVDIAPRAYKPSHQNILEGLSSLKPEKISSRREADEHLQRFIPEAPIRQFLLKNLVRDGNSYRFKLNLKAIKRNMDKIYRELDPSLKYPGPALFIRGALSNHIRPADEKTIQSMFPHSRLVTIEAAAHWVHADQPETFLRTVLDFLESG